MIRDLVFSGDDRQAGTSRFTCCWGALCLLLKSRRLDWAYLDLFAQDDKYLGHPYCDQRQFPPVRRLDIMYPCDAPIQSFVRTELLQEQPVPGYMQTRNLRCLSTWREFSRVMPYCANDADHFAQFFQLSLSLILLTFQRLSLRINRFGFAGLGLGLIDIFEW